MYLKERTTLWARLKLGTLVRLRAATILKNIYKSDSLEIAHFLANVSNTVSLTANTFEMPIKFNFSLDCEGINQKTLSSEIFSKSEIIFSDSFIGSFYEIFFKRISFPVKEPVSDNPKRNMKIWLSKERYGAIIMKFGFLINFIEKPISVLLGHKELLSLQMRLFGLQKDISLEDKDYYDNSLYVYIHNSTIKVVEKSYKCSLIVGLDNIAHHIFSTEISENLHTEIIKLKDVYFGTKFSILNKVDFQITKGTINSFVKERIMGKERKFELEICDVKNSRWTEKQNFEEMKKYIEKEKKEMEKLQE